MNLDRTRLINSIENYFNNVLRKSMEYNDIFEAFFVTDKSILVLSKYGIPQLIDIMSTELSETDNEMNNEMDNEVDEMDNEISEIDDETNGVNNGIGELNDEVNNGANEVDNEVGETDNEVNGAMSKINGIKKKIELKLAYGLGMDSITIVVVDDISFSINF